MSKRGEIERGQWCREMKSGRQNWIETKRKAWS